VFSYNVSTFLVSYCDVPHTTSLPPVVCWMTHVLLWSLCMFEYTDPFIQSDKSREYKST
jgi:hypothetical protein